MRFRRSTSGGPARRCASSSTSTISRPHASSSSRWRTLGSGREVTIRQLAEMVKEATGCRAFIEWDRTKPDGTPRKLCDTRLIRSLGWSPKIDLASGLRRTVDEYRAELAAGRLRV